MRKTSLNSVFELAQRDKRVLFIGSDLGPDLGFSNGQPWFGFVYLFADSFDGNRIWYLPCFSWQVQQIHYPASQASY